MDADVTKPITAVMNTVTTYRLESSGQEIVMKASMDAMPTRANTAIARIATP